MLSGKKRRHTSAAEERRPRPGNEGEEDEEDTQERDGGAVLGGHTAGVAATSSTGTRASTARHSLHSRDAFKRGIQAWPQGAQNDVLGSIAVQSGRGVASESLLLFMLACNGMTCGVPGRGGVRGAAGGEAGPAVDIEDTGDEVGPELGLNLDPSKLPAMGPQEMQYANCPLHALVCMPLVSLLSSHLW